MNPTAWGATALLLCSCAHGEARFAVKQASDVPAGPLAISLLGAYDGGSMNAAVSSEAAHELSGVLGAEPCVAGFNEQLEVANPEGFRALEAEAESRGIDDELLRMIAPAASGDVILALDMSGRLLTGEDEPSPPSERPGPKGPPSEPDPSARHRGAGFGQHSPNSKAGDPPRGTVARPIPDLEVSASFYSVRLHHTVSSVTMRYSGSSLDDGLRQLAEKLAAVFPRATCRPWNWEHVRVVHERDAAGLPLPLFHLVPDHGER